jgi:transposase-like protein
MSQIKLPRQFDTEEKCATFLETMRWPEGVRCPKCGHDRISRFQASGKTGKVRQLYQCLACRYQFSVRTGTIFHDSHLPLQKWFAAMALVGESGGTISANQLRQALDVQYKTAWQLAHRLREAMQQSVEDTVRERVAAGESPLDAANALPGQREHWERQVFLRFLEGSGRAGAGPLAVPRETVWAGSSPAPQISTRTSIAERISVSAASPRIRRPEGIPIPLDSGRSGTAGPIEELWGVWKRGVGAFGSFPLAGARHLPGYMNEVTYLFGSMLIAAMPTGMLCPIGKGLKRTLEARPAGGIAAK